MTIVLYNLSGKFDLTWRGLSGVIFPTSWNFLGNHDNNNRFGDNARVRVCGVFWSYFGVFGFHLGQSSGFFNSIFFLTITDFGDDGSVADCRVKSAGFFLSLFGFFWFPLRSIFGLFLTRLFYDNGLW